MMKIFVVQESETREHDQPVIIDGSVARNTQERILTKKGFLDVKRIAAALRRAISPKATSRFIFFSHDNAALQIGVILRAHLNGTMEPCKELSPEKITDATLREFRNYLHYWKFAHYGIIVANAELTPKLVAYLHKQWSKWEPKKLRGCNVWQLEGAERICFDIAGHDRNPKPKKPLFRVISPGALGAGRRKLRFPGRNFGE